MSISEPALYKTKWFDYRAMSPAAADMLFLSEWTAKYCRYMTKTGLDLRFGDNGIEYHLGVPYTSLADMQGDKGFWHGMIRLRQFCDREGWPYSDYWSATFKIIEDSAGFFACSIDGYGNINMKNVVMDAMQHQQKERLTLSSKKCFNVANYTGSRLQQDYRTYLLTEVTTRYPHCFMDKLQELVEQGQLKESWIIGVNKYLLNEEK